MRYLLLLLFLLMPTLAFAELPGAFDEPNEWAIWTFLTTTGGWMLRTWWKSRLEQKHKSRIEKKFEQEWSNGDETLPGTRNPGRTTPQLIEIVHEDLKQHKAETNRRIERVETESNKRFDVIHSDLGKIKGKLDIN